MAEKEKKSEKNSEKTSEKKKQSLETLPDEELLLRIRDREDVDAEELLLKRYGGVVLREVRVLYLVGAETEDLIQEAWIGLVKAIREYRADRGATFHTYATNCIRNQIRTAITASRRKKHQILNTYISINSYSTEEGEKLLAEQAGGKETNPETLYLNQECVEELEQRMREKLSPFEYKVAMRYLSGMSHAEIAEELGKPERSVNNALTRIRNKLKK